MGSGTQKNLRLGIDAHLIEQVRYALAEAVDALGDLPADSCTDRQRAACRACAEAHNSLFALLEGI